MTQKQKPMKRLPNDWADRMWDCDIEETLQHWQSRLDHYASLTDGLFPQRRGTDADIALCTSRVLLWTDCLNARRANQKVMPVIREYQNSTTLVP